MPGSGEGLGSSILNSTSAGKANTWRRYASNTGLSKAEAALVWAASEHAHSTATKKNRIYNV